MPSVVIFADLDSQIFGSLPFAEAFRSAGWNVVYDVPERERIPVTLIDHLEEMYPVVSEPLSTLAFSTLAQKADAIGVFTVGSKKSRFRADIAALEVVSSSRPFIFTGFNGVVYERYEEGIFWRLGYDVICLNGPRDELIFRAAVAGTPFEQQPVLITGLNKPKLKRRLPDRKLAVFAEQVIVPSTLKERTWMFSRLAEIASRNPSWDLVVKPRVRPDEQTFHKPILHPEGISQKWPENMSISYEGLPGLLSRASLLLTISSTSFFDAAAAGVPVSVIGDFGVKISLGTHYFANSGTVTYLNATEKFEDLVERKPSLEWLRATGATDEFSPKVLIDTLANWTRKSLPPAMPSRQLLALQVSTENAAKKPVKLETLIARGNAALANREYARAVTEFKAAIMRNGESVIALRRLAEAHMGLGDNDAAREALLRAQELQPANKDVANLLRSVDKKQSFLSKLRTKWRS